MPDEVNAGDRITYAAKDAGRQFDEMGLVLIPDEVLKVGDDVSVEFARRLVEDHVCRIVPDGQATEIDTASDENTPETDAAPEDEGAPDVDKTTAAETSPETGAEAEASAGQKATLEADARPALAPPEPMPSQKDPAGETAGAA